MCATKPVFGYSALFFIAVTNLLLSAQVFVRLIPFFLPGFNSFISSYRLILVVVLLQELTIFHLQITVIMLIFSVWFGTIFKKGYFQI